TPDGLGAAPGNLNAFQISSPLTYSPIDQVVSAAVISDERIFGGAMKSLASTFSPRRTCHGNSPSTYVVSAWPSEKCVKVVPAYWRRCLAPPANAGLGRARSVRTSFQCPLYSVKYRNPL